MLVMIGDLVQQGVTQNDFSVTGAILVGGTIGLLTVAVSYLNFRFPRLRPALEGEPVIVVEDGKPIERNLRRNRITLEELAAAARQQQIGSIGDVRWGVLETNGQLSFIPKSSDDLPGIEDPVRVEARSFSAAEPRHEVAVLPLEVAELAEPDPVLARARAAALERPVDDLRRSAAPPPRAPRGSSGSSMKRTW